MTKAVDKIAEGLTEAREIGRGHAAPRRTFVGAQDLDWLWSELRAAVIVRFRVQTPEVEAEVQRALRALCEALEADTS